MRAFYFILLVWFTMSCRFLFFFFKKKTAYEMRISDWSSDVCSSDLHEHQGRWRGNHRRVRPHQRMADRAANPLRPNVGNQGHALRLAVQDGRGAQCPDAAPRLFPSPQAARTAHLRAGAQALRRAGKMVDLGRNATEKDWRE